MSQTGERDIVITRSQVGTGCLRILPITGNHTLISRIVVDGDIAFPPPKSAILKLIDAAVLKTLLAVRSSVDG